MEETIQAVLSSQQRMEKTLENLPLAMATAYAALGRGPAARTPHATQNDLLRNMKRYIYNFLSFILFSPYP